MSQELYEGFGKGAKWDPSARVINADGLSSQVILNLGDRSSTIIVNSNTETIRLLNKLVEINSTDKFKSLTEEEKVDAGYGVHVAATVDTARGHTASKIDVQNDDGSASAELLKLYEIALMGGAVQTSDDINLRLGAVSADNAYVEIIVDGKISSDVLRIEGDLALDLLASSGDLDPVVADDFVFVSNLAQPVTEIYLGQQGGGFVDTNQNIAGLGQTGDVAVGDMDGDGDNDLVMFGTVSYRAVSLLLNDGTGQFTPGDFGAISTMPAGQTIASIYTYERPRDGALGDLDGDGDLDMVVAHDLGFDNRIYFNDGTGAMTESAQRLNLGATDPSKNTFDIELADFDGDGDLDILEVNTSGQTRVLFNDGAGMFTDSGISLASAANASVTDFDNDGDMDVVLSTFGFNGYTNLVYLNDGTGGFSQRADQTNMFTPAGNLGSAVVAGDLDGDGDDDFILGSNIGRKAIVWLNDGSGLFSDGAQFGGERFSADLELLDVDKDGDLDLIEAAGGNMAGSDSQHRIYYNDGLGGFSDLDYDAFGADSRSGGLAVGDFDGF